MKVKALLVGAFATLGTIGAVGGTTAYFLKQQKTQSYSGSFNTSNRSSIFGSNTSANYFNTNNIETNTTYSASVVNPKMASSFGEGIKSTPKNEIFGENFRFTISRQSLTIVNEAKEEHTTKFTLKITQEEATKSQGILYFITEQEEQVDSQEKELTQEISFTPGQEIKIAVKYVNEEAQKGSEKITIRNLLISGVNENHFLKTEKISDTVYSVKMPLEKDQKNQDGSNWLYESDKDSEVKVKATFIKESIGTDTKWTHGAYFGDLNGYAYNLTKDVKWSDIKNTIYTAFDNSSDKQNPIDIYIFLNGYTFTIDEDIDETYVPSGWALHFHNNGTDTATKEGKYGKIEATKEKYVGRIKIKGSLHLGSSVAFNSIPIIDGIGFLNSNELFGWIGVFKYNPANK